MTVALNDAELVRQIGSGTDRQAEAELFRRMAPRIRLYGLRHMRDEHAAEDLTQQVLITTIEALRAGRLREPERLASFVVWSKNPIHIESKDDSGKGPHGRMVKNSLPIEKHERSRVASRWS